MGESLPRRSYFPPRFPYWARCRCVCGWAGVCRRPDRDTFPTCPRCGRIPERADGPSLSVVAGAK
jgi:hypothetical protein